MDRMQKREPEFSAPMTPPLRLGVSMCLLGETVRYDGREGESVTILCELTFLGFDSD